MSRILVVDDSQAIADLLKVSLEFRGHKVVLVTHNFTNLLNIDDAKWKDVDALVCDIMLGDADITGRDILEVAAENFPRIKRVALTAVPEMVYERDHRLAQVVLAKPSGVTEILDVLDD